MKAVTLFLAPLLFVLSFLWPKNKHIWLFGAWFGKDYRDNSKILFEYILAHKSDLSIRYCWVYKDHALGTMLNQKDLPCVYAYSLKGILLQLQAKVFITCVNSSDFIPFLLTPRNYVVQLWHGSPMKKVGLDSRRKNSVRYLLDKVRFSTIDNYSLILSPAPIFDSLYAQAFSAKADKVRRGGYPRNDLLFVGPERKQEIRRKLGFQDSDLLLAYLPTHRKEGKAEGMSSMHREIQHLQTFDAMLKAAQATIVVKPHFYEKENLASLPNTDSIRILYDLPADLYEFLGSCDGLITDYSSVFFDFELLGLPIFIYPFDLEDYLETDRGMYFDFSYVYNKLQNCIKVNTMSELVASITDKSNYLEKNAKKGGQTIFNTPGPAFSEATFELLYSGVFNTSKGDH